MNNIEYAVMIARIPTPYYSPYSPLPPTPSQMVVTVALYRGVEVVDLRATIPSQGNPPVAVQQQIAEATRTSMQIGSRQELRDARSVLVRVEDLKRILHRPVRRISQHRVICCLEF